MSGAQTSTFADPNILLRTLSGQQTAGVLGQQIENQQNQLLMPYRVQGAAQQVGAAEMDTMGRAAAGLLSLPDENARAAAYPGVVQQLQANGFAKNAPAQYPGEATLRTFVGQALPVEKQYEMGILVPPGLSAALRGNQPPLPPSGTATAPAPARTGDFATDLATSESGGRPGIINSSGYTGLYQFGKQRLADLGYYTPAPGENMADNTNWAGKVSIPGFNVTDQASFAANPAAQKVAFGTHLANIDQAIDNTPGAANLDRNGLRAVAHLGGIDGMQRFVASGGAYNPADANGTRLSAYYQRFSGGGATPPASTAPGTTPPSGTTAVAATTPGGGKAVVIGDSLASSGGLGGSGVVGASPSAIRAQIADGARNGAYTGQDVVLSSGASNAPGDMANVEAQLKLLRDAGSVTLLGVGPGIEAKNPGTNAALQKLAAQYGARFQPLPTDQMSPDGVHPTAAGYASLKTATAPPGAAPQSGRYQVASNAPTPPPSATAPPAAPAQPPAATPPALPAVAQNQLAPPAPQPQLPPVQPPAAAQPPAAQPPQPGTAAAARANLPHYYDIPSGPNSQARQQWQAIQDQITQLIPYAQLPAAKARIAQLQSQQQVLMSTDSVVQTQEGPFHPLTGVLDDPRKVTPNYVYDPTQHAYIDTTGTNKPEFEPAQRDTAVAQRDVMELGPKVANGTATPQERAQYAVAATTYQQPTLRENPVTKETVRVNTRELPPGFPQPSGGASTPGGAPAGGGGPQVVMPGYSPAQQQVETDPAKYKVSESQYDRDSKEIAGIADAGRMAQADQIRIGEMQNVLQGFSSGPGTDWRTAASSWFQRWLPSALTGWEKESANLSGAQAAQVFAKLAVTGAGAQERSVLGNRGGFQAIKMFSAANPNIDLQDATNKSILDMQLISNQANQDYSQAAQEHFANNETKFSQTHQYDSLAQFDRDWNAQRNPQIYSAAMGAISGQPVEQWAKGLSRDGGQNSEYARALGIVGRAKPGTRVHADSGDIIVGPTTAATPAPPPGFTVVR